MVTDSIKDFAKRTPFQDDEVALAVGRLNCGRTPCETVALKGARIGDQIAVAGTAVRVAARADSIQSFLMTLDTDLAGREE